MATIFQILILLILIILNGFFVAAETSLLMVRKSQITLLSGKGNKLAQLIHRATDNIGLYISATQFGNTLISVALGWLGHPIIEKWLIKLFSIMNSSDIGWQATFIGLTAFILITLFNLVFGELIPKTIAIYNPRIFSFIIIIPLFLFVRLFLPFISGLNKITHLILRIFGLSVKNKNYNYTREEFKMILEQCRKDKIISEGEVKMLSNTLKLNQIKISQVMISIEKLIGFYSNETIENIRNKILKSNLNYHHFPIFNSSKRHIIGFVNLFDILKFRKHLVKDKAVKDTSLINKVIYVKNSSDINNAMADMMKNKIHVAVVTDRSDRNLGLVAFSDIVIRLSMLK